MRLVSLRVLGAVTGLLVVAGAVHVLREATMSTHYDTGPDSRVTVVVRAEQNRAEAGVSLAAAAAAQIGLCNLEVGRTGEVRPVPGTDDRFRVILSPALDSTDQTWRVRPPPGTGSRPPTASASARAAGTSPAAARARSTTSVRSPRSSSVAAPRRTGAEPVDPGSGTYVAVPVPQRGAQVDEGRRVCRGGDVEEALVGLDAFRYLNREHVLVS